MQLLAQYHHLHRLLEYVGFFWDFFVNINFLALYINIYLNDYDFYDSFPQISKWVYSFKSLSLRQIYVGIKRCPLYCVCTHCDINKLVEAPNSKALN